MSRIVDGFKDQVWVIKEMDAGTVVKQFTRPAQQANEVDIILFIETLARRHLKPEDAERAPTLWRHRRDGTGERSVLIAGQNPHYVAALYRMDEI